MAKPKRVAVFGGAFDPPHLAHLALLEAALAHLALDELRVIPTGQAWHKSRSLSPADHRVAMAKLAFGPVAKVLIDERELRRAGPSYTIDTVRELQAEQPASELFLLLGGDQARALPTWNAWQEVLTIATICIAERPYNSTALATKDLYPWLRERFLHLPLPLSPISATDVRQRVARHEDVSPLVGPAVARYIAQHHLYSTST